MSFYILCWVESEALLIILIISGPVGVSSLPPQSEGYNSRLLVLVREHTLKNKRI
jgi:hypothetical protein